MRSALGINITFPLQHWLCEKSTCISEPVYCQHRRWWHVACAGDMWSLGVLMYVVLTGGVPPFAQSLAQAGCRGMCADALQRLVSAALARGLAASALSEPLPRAAQVGFSPILSASASSSPRLLLYGANYLASHKGSRSRGVSSICMK